VVALVAVGDVVLGMRSSGFDTESDLTCATLKLALDEAKTGFSKIAGEPTKLPYHGYGSEINTDYPTTFKFPSSNQCSVTREDYVNSDNQASDRHHAVLTCYVPYRLEALKREIESCLMKFGGWVSNNKDDAYFEKSGEAGIRIPSGWWGNLTVRMQEVAQAH
jgi:hypothetical protein